MLGLHLRSKPIMRNPVAVGVAVVGVCLVVGVIAMAEVREPIAKSTRYTARRGSTNLPNPQPTSLEECRARIRAAYEAEGRTRTTGAIVYQCITTESHIVTFQPAPVAPRGTATLSWTPPTQNTDGSSLTNLVGYRIHYGTTQDLAQTIQVANPGASTYAISGLAPGTYYFAVRAYTSNGTESGLSNIGQKTVL